MINDPEGEVEGGHDTKQLEQAMARKIEEWQVCRPVCVCVCVHVYLQTCKCTYARTYVNLRTCMHTYTHSYMHACITSRARRPGHQTPPVCDAGQRLARRYQARHAGRAPRPRRRHMLQLPREPREPSCHEH